LTGPDKVDKIILAQGFERQAEVPVEMEAVSGIEDGEDLKNIALLIVRDIASFIHHRFDRIAGEKFEKSPVVVKPMGFPGKTDILVTEA